jgi:importin-5
MSSKNELLSVISSFMSTNNNLRKEAEEFYSNRMTNDLFVTVQDLLSIITDDTVDISVRSLAAILLRRAVDNFQAKTEANPEYFAQFRQALLGVWLNQSEKTILKRLCHVLAQASIAGPWADLIPHMLAHAKQCNGHEIIIISTMQFIETLAGYSPDEISTNINGLGEFLSSAVSSTNHAMQVAAARAICASIVNVEDDSLRAAFKYALSSIITILGAALSRGEVVDATNIMEYLVDIADVHPIFFRGSLDSISETMLAIANSQSVDFSTRSMAIEVLITICEKSPALARKCQVLMNGILPTAMTFMLELDLDDDEWKMEKYSDEQPDDSCLVGEEAIERLATGLGGKIVIPRVSALIQQYASSMDFRFRRAAVAALIRLAEGCTEMFEASVEGSIPLLSMFASDSSARVQYEVIHVSIPLSISINHNY